MVCLSYVLGRLCVLHRHLRTHTSQYSENYSGTPKVFNLRVKNCCETFRVIDIYICIVSICVVTRCVVTLYSPPVTQVYIYIKQMRKYFREDQDRSIDRSIYWVSGLKSLQIFKKFLARFQCLQQVSKQKNRLVERFYLNFAFVFKKICKLFFENVVEQAIVLYCSRNTVCME
eukprot:TRINITY_DN9090_c0_g1_i2.p1 TRINITY_DN9090_c0_g1~~TRINITY_DN9090_c0_g1_i2.p1  ORF type:complete len:186 (+),score=-16.25 TRINITY_DN9090_c0_g1_i2:41-559(+)